LAGSQCFSQGQINLDNNVNTGTSPTATSNDFSSSTQMAQVHWALSCQCGLNVSFYGGSDVNSLVLLRTFAGASAQGGNLFWAGTFTDPQGVAATNSGRYTSAVFKIEAWTGPATTYANAVADPAAIFTLGPIVFNNPVAIPPTTPPTSLTCLPSS